MIISLFLKLWITPLSALRSFTTAASHLTRPFGSTSEVLLVRFVSAALWLLGR